MNISVSTGKARKLIGKHGVIKAITIVLNYLKSNIFSCSIETYYVFEKDLNKPIPVISPKINVILYKIDLNQSNINDLITYWPNYFRFSRTDEELKRSLIYYLNCGDECFCVKYNNTIVGMIWLGYQNNYMLKSLAAKIGLRKDEAILHRLYVNSDLRRQHVSSFMLSSCMNYIKVKGYNKCFVYVGIRNISSILVCIKKFDKYRIIHCLEIVLLGIRFNIFPEYSRDDKLLSLNV